MLDYSVYKLSIAAKMTNLVGSPLFWGLERARTSIFHLTPDFWHQVFLLLFKNNLSWPLSQKIFFHIFLRVNASFLQKSTRTFSGLVHCIICQDSQQSNLRKETLVQREIMKTLARPAQALMLDYALRCSKFNDPRVAPLVNTLYAARRAGQRPESLCFAREWGW
jgi:hypothetical protein